MKYQRLVSNTTPSSLQDWLEEELESRGIDGVYTRYILSLLQQDYLDLEPAECQHTTLTGHQRKKCDEFGCKDYVLSFSKARHQKWKNWEKERLLGLSTTCCGLDLSSNLEERNKIAAVECLKSASEEKFGIEKLIDEVCFKLKNVKTTSEKSKADEEDSDYIEKDTEEIPPSSPNDPAEKYYEAFPALNGKTEPMTELCQQQQQNKTDALEGAWNGRLVKDSINQKVNENNTDNLSVIEETVKNATFENGGGNVNKGTQNCSVREFKIIDQEENVKDEGKITEPSFIVPKVKTSLVRKPFSTGYLPFNQLRKHAQDSFFVKDVGEVEGPTELLESQNKVQKETNAKEEGKGNSVNGSGILPPAKKELESKDVKKDFIGNSEEARAFESLFENFCDCEKLGILMYAALTDVSNSDLCADEKDKFSVEQLLSKFNSSLASIWKSNGHNTNQKDLISGENREIKLPSEESFGVVYDESVWACHRGEIENKKSKIPISSSVSRVSKVLSSKENNELYSDINDIKPLPRNEQKFANESLPKNVTSFLNSENKENSESTCSPKILLDASLQENLSRIPENDIISELDASLDQCPEQFSPGVENFDDARHLPNIGSERGNVSPKSDEIHSASAIWKPQDTSHMLDQNLKKIWDPSPLGETSNWLAIPVKHDHTDWENREFFNLPSHSDVQAHWNQKCEQDEKSRNEFLSKGKCTLTYHKGESKFVEVVPSHKQKSAVLEDSLDAIEGSALFQSDSALSSIGYLSDEEYEEEENLLTSPKTHFQPIRHDSLDTDNSDDLEVMMLTRKAVGCSPVSHESIVDFNHADFVSTLPSDKENSPKKYCHIELKKIRGKRISPKNFSSNQLTSPAKEVKRGRTISSSYDELASLTGHISSHDYSGIDLASQNSNALNFLSFHFWKADNFKDKGTNTDTSLCMGLDSITKQCSSCWEEAESVVHLPEKDFTKEFFSPEIKIWHGCEEISKTPGRKRTISKWKWSTNDDNNNMEDMKWFPSSYMEWSSVNEPKSKALLKAFGSNTDINALRQEIKEEEEELLRNISYLNSSSVKDEIDISNENKNCDFFFGRSGRGYQSRKTVDKRNELFTAEGSMLIQNGFLEWNSSDESFSEQHVFRDFYDRSFSLGDLDMDTREHPFPAVPADKILYSSDLENEWRKTSQSFRIQAPHKRAKYKYPPQKRPCSFYLEGNCRRSDCRFSHDLSTITCRFWEENTCFKGETCPFLHGYNCDMGFSERNNTPDCKYTLESEADFPSLSASKNGIPPQKSNPQEISVEKGNRPKRKKGKSQSSWNPKKATQLAVSSSWPGCKGFMKTLECSPE